MLKNVAGATAAALLAVGIPTGSHLATAARLLQTERVSNLLVGLDSTENTVAAKAAIGQG